MSQRSGTNRPQNVLDGIDPPLLPPNTDTRPAPAPDSLSLPDPPKPPPLSTPTGGTGTPSSPISPPQRTPVLPRGAPTKGAAEAFSSGPSEDKKRSVGTTTTTIASTGTAGAILSGGGDGYGDGDGDGDGSDDVVMTKTPAQRRIPIMGGASGRIGEESKGLGTGSPFVSPAPLAAETWELRWGNRTWMAALLVSVILSMIILAAAWRFEPDGKWFKSIYVPLLGYYTLFGIYLFHFYSDFPQPTPEPNLVGTDRYIVVFVVTCVLWWVHDEILRSILPAARVMNGHIAFIIIGFFCGAWEDTCWGGVQLTKIFATKYPKTIYLRGVFWYFFSWGIWLIVPFSICRIYLVEADIILLQWFLATTQMAIVTQLAAAIWTKPFWAMIPIAPQLKGFLMTGAWWLNAAVVTGILYSVTRHFWPAGKPADIWHFCTACGSYPLAPAICLGFYGNAFRTYFSSKTWHLIASYCFITLFSIVDFILYHLVYTEFGVTGEAASWYQDTDLTTNFTINLFLLTWTWFTGKYLLSVKVAPKPIHEEPFHSYDVEMANCGSTEYEDSDYHSQSYTQSTEQSDTTSIQGSKMEGYQKQAPLLGATTKSKSGRR
ncbi:hypothetical protein Pelo_11640 [Pelomyxa schiedti]|nr:hypothetical protein Pelo_11640 [Pelomyxa schiedti]